MSDTEGFTLVTSKARFIPWLYRAQVFHLGGPSSEPVAVAYATNENRAVAKAIRAHIENHIKHLTQE